VFTRDEPTGPEAVRESDEVDNADAESYMIDRNQSIGIAAGYVNMVSTLLGYSTGCCKCFDDDAVQDILGSDTNPILIMGIGYPDKTKNRLQHHEQDFRFSTATNMRTSIRH
jgi:hypothetical protein